MGCAWVGDAGLGKVGQAFALGLDGLHDQRLDQSGVLCLIVLSCHPHCFGYPLPPLLVSPTMLLVGASRYLDEIPPGGLENILSLSVPLLAVIHR